MSHFKYFERTVPNQNFIHETIKRKLGLLQFSSEYLFCCLFPKHMKSKVNKTITVPVVLNECETLSLTQREEYSLRF